MKGQHLISQWSRTQQLIALSSAEAELSASIKAGCESLGVKYMSEELGRGHSVDIFGDSSANHGIAHRSGSGKMKHLNIRQLWLQERVHLGHLKFTKVPREINLSDALTHHWSSADGAKHFHSMGGYRRSAQWKYDHAHSEGGSSRMTTVA